MLHVTALAFSIWPTDGNGDGKYNRKNWNFEPHMRNCRASHRSAQTSGIVRTEMEGLSDAGKGVGVYVMSETGFVELKEMKVY